MPAEVLPEHAVRQKTVKSMAVISDKNFFIAITLFQYVRFKALVPFIFNIANNFSMNQSIFIFGKIVYIAFHHFDVL